MAIKYWLDGNANWTTAANWTGGTVPGAADDVTVYQGNPFPTAPISIKSLTTIAPGSVDFQNAVGTSQVSTNVTNGGNLFLDRFGGQGGSNLNIANTLTNTGYTQIGNGSLGASTTLSTAKIVNTGTIELNGSASRQATLAVNAVAGFGTSQALTGTLRLFGNTLVSFTSGQIKTLAAGSYLRLNGTNARVALTGNTGSNSALTGLSSINRNATFMLNNGASAAVASTLNNYGTLELDYFGGDGGASLSIGSRLTNNGYVQIGNGALSAASTLSTNTITNLGTIELNGSATKKATLAINNAAGFGTAATLTGTLRLFGNTLVSFTTGQIKTLAANSYLRINGPNAFVANASSTTSNSALTGLASIGRGAQFFLDNGASVSTAGFLNNYGNLYLDFFGGEGGSSLSVATKLTNNGYIQIGNGALSDAATFTTNTIVNTGTIELNGNGTNRATLNVVVAAGFGTTGILTGTVRQFGNTLTQFASGGIKTLAANSYLRLNGVNAFMAITGSTSSNSALTGLTTVSRGAQFFLDNGASVAITGSLTNYGSTFLDFFGGEGGATLSVSGRFDNQNFLQVGNGSLSANTTVTFGSLNNNGSIEIYGSNINDGVHTDYTGRLIVNAAAGTGTAGHLTGSVYLQGHSLLQFASGQITTIDNGASLRINSAYAFVATAGNTTSNSALTGLTDIEGSLYLSNGATIATTGDVVNTGSLFLDYFGGERGSSMSVAGTFDNENYLQIGNGGQTLGETLTVASLINDGSINIIGGTGKASLVANSAAGTGVAGELSGAVSLQGNALLQFASGQIDSIDYGASLRINGAAARVARAGNLSTNSALTGLTQIDGTLTLDNSASVITTGALTNFGTINLDPFGGESGAALTVGGALTNEGTIALGNGRQSLGEVLTAASLTNNGSINLNGNAAAATPAYASLAIAGSIVNNGSIYLSNNKQMIASNVTGFGSFTLANSSTLQLNGSVASAQTVDLSIGADKLVLGNAKTFAGTIDDFSFGDTIDLTTFGAGTTFSYAQNAANTGGLLTVTNGANVAKLNFDGVYSTANFTASADGAGGTLFSYT